MAGKRKASDDAPGTPRPPAPRRENERRYMESPHIARLFNGGSGNDADQSTRAVVPPPPPPYMRATNVMDAYSMSLQRQDRELSVNLRGRAARDYACGLSEGGSAAGEENEVSSPWTFVALSDLFVPQPPASDHPSATAARYHSVAEVARALAPATATAVDGPICKSCWRWTAATPCVPFKHICLCVHCRHSPYARICCSVCGAGRHR